MLREERGRGRERVARRVGWELCQRPRTGGGSSTVRSRGSAAPSAGRSGGRSAEASRPALTSPTRAAGPHAQHASAPRAGHGQGRFEASAIISSARGWEEVGRADAAAAQASAPKDDTCGVRKWLSPSETQEGCVIPGLRRRRCARAPRAGRAGGVPRRSAARRSAAPRRSRRGRRQVPEAAEHRSSWTFGFSSVWFRSRTEGDRHLLAARWAGRARARDGAPAVIRRPHQHWHGWRRGVESRSIIWGKKCCITSPPEEGAGGREAAGGRGPHRLGRRRARSSATRSQRQPPAAGVRADVAHDRSTDRECGALGLV